MEHGSIGRAYGHEDHAHDIRLACHGLDRNDNDFITGLVGKEKCKFYPTAAKPKPIGLLQEYGEDEDIHFGLITGSYQKNKSGGTLRKNIGPITDEINHTTDGTFKAPPAAGNIINNLQSFSFFASCECFIESIHGFILQPHQTPS